MSASIVDTALYDPIGEAPITSKLVTIKKPEAMLNNYKRVVKVGGGQHGTVYLCLQKRKGEPPLAVAMKSVKRVNPRDKYELLRKGHLPRSPNGVSVADRVNTTEEKIRKEIAIMKKLRHPHVVRLYEVIDDRMREKIYIVMEYLGGGEVIWQGKDNKPLLTVDQTRRIMRDALLGLEYLHYQGIIHRDIKPANLLYTFGRSHVKIGDFGVSHFSYAQRLAALGAAGGGPASQDQMDPILLDNSALTMRAGTPMFIAPEVVWEYRIPTTTSSPSLSRGQLPLRLPRSASIPDRSSAGGSSATPLSALGGDGGCSPTSGTNSPSSSSGRPPITKAIDVWALGITFFCLLTGTLPYEASANEWALFAKIANQNIMLPDVLGADRVPVAGRRVIDHDGEKERLGRKSEGKQKLKDGHLVFELLEGLLQRDPANRMTLDKFKSSQFILTGVPEPESWLRLTSPTARISVDSNDTSHAMSPLRFRAGWGTRLVRQFSSLWSKGGNTIVSSPPSPRRKISGALSIATQVPHLIKSVATSTAKASPTAVTTSTVTSTLQRRRSRVDRGGTLSGAIGRRLPAGTEDGKTLTSLPLDDLFDPILSTPLSADEDATRQHPTDPMSMGWWKRSVAGILSWSPDRYQQLPVEKRNPRDRRGKKEEKEEKKEGKRLTKKGSKTVRAEGDNNLVRELAWLSDPELVLDVEDPMLTSRTFDSYTPTPTELQLPWSVHNGRHSDMTPGLSNPQNEPLLGHLLMRNTSMPPPTSHHSEEVFRTYLPSPASAEDAKFFTNARRASSWGQGDRTEYEVQSITSDAALSDAFEVREHVMWRGSEGLYVMDQGVLVPVSTSDEGDRVSSGAIVPAGGIMSPLNNNGGCSGPGTGAGPGPSTARYRANQALASAAVHGSNVQRLASILDDPSSPERNRNRNRDTVKPSYDSEDELGAAATCNLKPKLGEGNIGGDENQENWSEEDPYDDDDASSDDHALTFSPSNRRVVQYDDYDNHDG